jgi:hypothetical protein
MAAIHRHGCIKYQSGKNMKQVFFFLMLMMLGVACPAQQKVKHRVIRITVIDKNTGLPVDSAKVIISMMVDARDVVSDVKYADQNGHCSFQVDANPLASGRAGAFKKGFIGYFDDNYIDLDRSFANVNKTDKNIVLYLTSDSLNHINYWKKITIRYDIDTLISLLKSNKYPDRSAFPLLFWEDIPKLLTSGNNRTMINKYPISLISSGSTKDCYLGIVSLWFIESTRITVLKKAFEPLEKFPSQSPGLLDKSKPGSRQNNIETMERAYQAYKIWWEKVKKMDKEQGCKINPLENTGLEW